MTSPVVTDAIAYWDELLAGPHAPAGWWSEHVEEVRRHWHDEAPMDSYLLRPYFIDEATYVVHETALARVMDAFAIASTRLAQDEALRRALGLPAYLEPLLEIDRAHGKPTCLGRLDAIPSSDGRLAILELNSEPQSAAFQYELERSFERLAITRAFARRFRVRTVDLYAQVYATLAERGRPCIAILDKALWRQPRRASIFRPLMYCSARGCPVVYVDPEELEYKAGKLTTSTGIAIDMVAFNGWDLLINARKRLAKVIKAIADGAVDVFAGLSRGLLCSYKTIFELLSSAQYRSMFSHETAEALDRYVPWTRLLREHTTDRDGAMIDLLPYVAEHRAHLVIKPAGGGGGGNITIGRDATDDVWAEAIRRGVAQGWVVQELAVAERQPFAVANPAGEISRHELACEYTPYVHGGTRIDGVLCRAVAGSVIFDLGDRPIGISNGVEAATWIIERAER